jgi:prepilin peptidase CpaA
MHSHVLTSMMDAAACLAQVTLVQWIAVIGASLVDAVLDLKSRRIPNWLTVPLAVSGLLAALGRDGLPGLGWAVAGCGLLALPYILLFALGHGGAGDAKMMGAVGAWLGLHAGVVVLVAVTLTGGALALLRIVVDGQRRRHFAALFALLYVSMIAARSGRQGLALLRSEPSNGPSQGLTMPYGPAIFIGLCIAACMAHAHVG